MRRCFTVDQFLVCDFVRPVSNRRFAGLSCRFTRILICVLVRCKLAEVVPLTICVTDACTMRRAPLESTLSSCPLPRGNAQRLHTLATPRSVPSLCLNLWFQLGT